MRSSSDRSERGSMGPSVLVLFTVVSEESSPVLERRRFAGILCKWLSMSLLSLTVPQIFADSR